MHDYAYLPLFVYGTLMTDQPAYNLIAGAVERSARAWLPGLALYNVGRYPLAAPGEGTVYGEIHWLRQAGYAELLKELELYEGPEYRRARHQAFIEGRDETAIEVWVFIGESEYARRLPRISGGDWQAWRHNTG
jgi:gamma-glutamylcyclotransferase (GGCT)/AIG2-like uncharacterized protein YtfP